ncbi:ImmA/IrrE family metallo-endopeptidase [Streptomyces sp. F63]|uniref:helix-turn-helix domain-containing protein n=1 Tax=Streptomyces sp. F63 TaxID=2824887 RepID=UPI001B39A328|nr:XRE family transcriptional regulator [Streptomyces sp. F63]MBQ0985203.1 ImmA/IrrE family metallo-endopeptidase [Streptomyces sp. F63]
MGEARRAAQLTQAQLAERLGLERSAVSKIESGTRRIGALELTKLADALGLPVDHFLAAPVAVLSHRQPLAEEDESDAARSAFRTEAQLSSWLRDVRQLRGFGVLPERELWGYPGKAPDNSAYRTAARWVRERLGNAREPLGSMAEVCARAGQWPLVAAIPGDGASLVDGDIAVCVISERGDPGRRRATAAHELGHLIMGDAYSNDLGVHASVDERERAIEAFAAELLLPTAAIESRWIAGSPEREQLIGLAARYRVSWTLALIQAERAEVIDSDSRNELTARRPTRAEFLQALGWVPEPDLSAVKVAPAYADAVLAALRQRMVTRARAVEMMHGQVSLADLPPDDDDGDG